MEVEININHVSQTAFITQCCHALDAQSKRPILNDQKSIATIDILKQNLSKSNQKYHQRLVKGKIDRDLIQYISLRAKKYDDYVRDFIKKNPDATVINIGCGLDYRFERVDNGSIIFYDLDLPDIINIKSQLFQESDRYKLISQSVFDFSWMEEIQKSKVILLAEGVFMYCYPEDVKKLFLELGKRFSNSEMVCEMMHSFWITGWRKKLVDYKMQKDLGIGKDATFHFGAKSSKDIENWSQAIKHLDDWSFYDSSADLIGWKKIFGKIQFIRNTIWTAHYSIG